VPDPLPATDAEIALIRAEHLSGVPTPDAAEPADMAIWRAEHQAELAAGEAAVHQAAAELEYVARAELEADLEP
jgi:hypothetical protein